MTYLDLNNPNRPSLSLFLKISCFVAICFLAWLWGWKNSGVLETTKFFDINPLGYAYILETQNHGLWPINRESFYYLNGMQAFLGVPGTAINLGNGYEISRLLYCLLLRSFWFLEPIVASFVLDIILWFLAALSAAYIAGTFSKSKIAPWIAAIAVVFGQGFLHSVGEGIPHVLGYAGGFYIGALICFFRTWQKTCSLSEDLVIYVFIALWQIGYGTALFFLPLAMLCTWHRLQELSLPLGRRFVMLVALAFVSLLPFMVITIIMRFVTQVPGEMGLVIKGMAETYLSIIDYLKAYLKVFWDGLLSLGPLITLSSVLLFFYTVSGKFQDLKWLFLAFLIPYLAIIFMITPLSGRGYATFNLVLIPLIFLALKLSEIIETGKYGKLFASIIVSSMVLIMMLYPNSIKFGYLQPNQAFQSGWFDKNISKIQTYEIHLFE